MFNERNAEIKEKDHEKIVKKNETNYIVSSRTLTKKEIEEQLKKKYETDWNYGRGEWC